MKKPSIKKLPNGLAIVQVPSESPSVTVSVFVGTGSRNENENEQGISHFLEHLCFKGTLKKSGKEIMRYLDGLGAETNAFTSQELTAYYVKSITKHWKKTLRILRDIYLSPSFPEHEIEKEKGVIQGEIDMYEDLPTSRVHELLMQAIFPDHPLGKSILGTKKSIRKMTRNDIVDYHTCWYLPRRTTIVVAGKLGKHEVFKEVEKLFTTMPQKDSSSKKKSTVFSKQNTQASSLICHYKKTDQTHIGIAFEGKKRNHQDALVLKLIATLLGGGMSSRLFELLREDMGAGYYIYAHHSGFSDKGIFSLQTGIESKRLDEVVLAILREFEILKSELVDESELAKSLEYLRGNSLMSLESTDALSYYYGKQIVLDSSLKTPKEYLKRLGSVSPRDIKRVARSVFKKENLKLVVLGPHRANQQGKLVSIIKKSLS